MKWCINHVYVYNSSLHCIALRASFIRPTPKCNQSITSPRLAGRELSCHSRSFRLRIVSYVHVYCTSMLPPPSVCSVHSTPDITRDVVSHIRYPQDLINAHKYPHKELSIPSSPTNSSTTPPQSPSTRPSPSSSPLLQPPPPQPPQYYSVRPHKSLLSLLIHLHRD